jgi:GTPase SAR1 family protein
MNPTATRPMLSDSDDITVAVLGAAGVGKTAWLDRLQQRGEFQPNHYEATDGVVMHTGVFQTSKKREEITFLDTSGQERYAGFNTERLLHTTDAQGKIVSSRPRPRGILGLGTDAAIVMFDMNSTNRTSSLREAEVDIAHLRTMYGPTMPIILYGTKADMLEESWHAYTSDITQVLHKHHHVRYYYGSAKSNLNMDRPLMHIIRELRGDPDLTLELIEDTPAVRLPEIVSLFDAYTTKHSQTASPSKLAMDASTMLATNTESQSIPNVITEQQQQQQQHNDKDNTASVQRHVFSSADFYAFKSAGLETADTKSNKQEQEDDDDDDNNASSVETRMLEAAWNKVKEQASSVETSDLAQADLDAATRAIQTGPVLLSSFDSLTTIDASQGVDRAMMRMSTILGHLSGVKNPSFTTTCGTGV